LVFFLTVLPVLTLVASIFGVTWFCHSLLEEAKRVDVDLPSLLPLLLGVFGICLVSCLLAVTHGVRLQRRLGGPTLRLIAGMQRVRVGDLSFRVHLRRGDYLSELAFEFNKVIDWLNENPPEGVRTGSDVVDVYAPDQDDPMDGGFDEIDFGLDGDEIDAELAALDRKSHAPGMSARKDAQAATAAPGAAPGAAPEAAPEAATPGEGQEKEEERVL